MMSKKELLKENKEEEQFKDDMDGMTDEEHNDLLNTIKEDADKTWRKKKK